MSFEANSLDLDFCGRIVSVLIFVLSEGQKLSTGIFRIFISFLAEAPCSNQGLCLLCNYLLKDFLCMFRQVTHSSCKLWGLGDCADIPKYH